MSMQSWWARKDGVNGAALASVKSLQQPGPRNVVSQLSTRYFPGYLFPRSFFKILSA